MKTLYTITSSLFLFAAMFNARIHFAEQYHDGTIIPKIRVAQDYGSRDDAGMQARAIRFNHNYKAVGHATYCVDHNTCGGEVDPLLQTAGN